MCACVLAHLLPSLYRLFLARREDFSALTIYFDFHNPAIIGANFDFPKGLVILCFKLRFQNRSWGIVKLSKFDQKLGNTRIHNSLIFQHSCYRPEVENQPKLT